MGFENQSLLSTPPVCITQECDPKGISKKAFISSILIGFIFGFFTVCQIVFMNDPSYSNAMPIIYFAISIVINLITPFIFANLGLRSVVIAIITLTILINILFVFVGNNFFFLIIAPVFGESLTCVFGSFIVSYSNKKSLPINIGIVYAISNILIYQFLGNAINNFKLFYCVYGIIALVCCCLMVYFMGKLELNDSCSSLMGDNNSVGSFVCNVKSFRFFNLLLLIPSFIFPGTLVGTQISSYANIYLSDVPFISSVVSSTYMIYMIVGSFSLLVFGYLLSRSKLIKIITIISFIVGMVGISIGFLADHIHNYEALVYSQSILTIIPSEVLLILSVSIIGSHFCENPLYAFTLFRLFYNIGSISKYCVSTYVQSEFVIVWFSLILFAFGFIGVFEVNSRCKSNTCKSTEPIIPDCKVYLRV